MFYLTFYPYNVICNIEKVPSTNELNKLIWIVRFETTVCMFNIVNYEVFFFLSPCSLLSHLKVEKYVFYMESG